MKFAKYHGTGNDFILIEDLAGAVTLTTEAVAALCHRQFGIGADGLIRIASSDGADYFMDYWNADGDVAEMCGNGIRCLAKYVYERGLTAKTELAVDTRAGTKRLWLEVESGGVSAVRVDMGEPTLERGAIPMAGPFGERFLGQPFLVDGTEYSATAVSMGNPHVVLFGAKDLESVDLRRLGPIVEYDERFPDRTNVEFVKVEGGTVHVRVWERGVGETMACGTGACASLVAANVAGLVGSSAPVRFPGGTLEVEWASDNHLYLTGPAAFVFEGELGPIWTELAAARP